MGFQGFSRERGRRTRVVVAGALALGLALSGCAPDYTTDSNAPVYMVIAAMHGGAVLDSDIRIGANSTIVCEDDITVEVAVRNKNPKAPAPNMPAAVLLKSYEVRYFRTDGRGTEGVDVPYRITGNLSLGLDVQTSGTVGVPIEIVRRQAKLEPPLTTIFQTSAVLTVMAELTLYGETIPGEKISASGRMQIDFANFGDKQETCPQQ